MGTRHRSRARDSRKVTAKWRAVDSALAAPGGKRLEDFRFIVLLPRTNDTARATLLLMALPSGFFGLLFGLRYGVESQEVGSTLIVSSLFSIVTLAIMLIFTASL
jgi:malonate transporter and related proteins